MQRVFRKTSFIVFWSFPTMNQILHTSLTNPDRQNSTVLLLFAHLISVSVMLYFPVYTTIVCEVEKINLSNAMLSKSGPGRMAGGGRSKPTKTTHTPPRETGERREGRSICFSYSQSWAERGGQQSSGHWCGPFNHTCVLLASPLNTTTGPKK